MSQQLNPSSILQLGEGFMASKTLLSAVELDLFSYLGDRAMTGRQIAAGLGLHERAIPDFPDSLVALGMLSRQGDGPDAEYRNTPETAAFLDKSAPAYVGGLLEMCNARLYGYWGDLTEGLRTGEPQSEAKQTGQSMFTELYRDPAGLEQFMNAMSGASAGGFHALAETFDFSTRRTLCDVGGATGQLSVIVARRHPQMRCTTFDLPAVEPLAKAAIADAGVGDRVTAEAGDFFEDPLPQAEVITMGMVLHDWNLEQKKHLIRAAYDALSPGGTFIAIEPLIDDERRNNPMSLLLSLNMLIEFGDAFGFTGQDFAGWCREAGFERTEIRPLAGPMMAALAHK
jgi:hypothetical protein